MHPPDGASLGFLEFTYTTPNSQSYNFVTPNSQSYNFKTLLILAPGKAWLQAAWGMQISLYRLED